MNLRNGRLTVWGREQLNRFQGSLFGRPALSVLVAVIAALALTDADRRTGSLSLPTFADTTVDSSRALLGAITSGTISAASVVFSLTLVAIQLSSTTYSSRVVRTFLRDRFQQRVIGLVMGTFAYSMLVLRAVRSEIEGGGAAFVPRFSILVATFLALASLLALIASINHTAQNLRVSTISAQLVRDIKGAIDNCLPRDPDPDSVRPPASRSQETAEGSRTETQPGRASALGLPAGMGTVLTAADAGWVQQISLPVIRNSIDDGSTVRIEVAPGSYVFADAPLLTIWPPPQTDEMEDYQEHLRGAFSIGSERSLQQDLAFGLVLLEDITVRALSPGVNDPNTAREMIPQIGEIVLDILSRPLPPTDGHYEGCHVLRPTEAGYDDYVRAAFAQIRRCASGQAEVMASLITTTATVGSELIRRRQSSSEAIAALSTLAGRLADDVARAEIGAEDRHRLNSLLDDLEWRT